MKTLPRIPTGHVTPADARSTRPARPLLPDGGLAARALLGCLERLEEGRLHLRAGDAEWSFGAPAEDGLEATVEVTGPRFWSSLLLRGSVGAGESYVRGEWRADDLPSVVRLLVRNRAALESLEGGLARLALPALKLVHALRRNTLSGAERNIRAHYDLSNEFYALFLDPSMTYSCALFEEPGASLEEAQRAKIDLACRKLELQPSDHLLEIGTGWGALALQAAREYGCRVTTTTLSERQHAWASRRVREEGLENRITLLRRDYRQLEGNYDKLVSIEMIEAVGARYLETFLATSSRLLVPGGQMLLQAITIDDRLYARALRSVDFIQRYVFPGAFIPSVGAISAGLTRATDLRLFHLDDIGPHYAPTLAAWRGALLARADQVRALGFDQELVRLYEFYFAYCEGGYAEGQLGNVQMLLTKPRCRRQPLRSTPDLAARCYPPF